MAQLRRQKLSDALHAICEHVYFQPSANVHLVYPCIVYSRAKIDAKFADSEPYVLNHRFSVMYISRTPDDEALDKIARLRTCSSGQFYTADNLYHYPFMIYE